MATKNANAKVVEVVKEDVTDLQQAVNEEVKQLEVEIDALKTTIKEKQKRIKELTKKGSVAGPSKKQLIIDWLKANPEATELAYLTFALNEQKVSAIYASTLLKNYKKEVAAAKSAE